MVKLLVLRLLLQKIIEQQEQIHHHLLDEGHALKVLPVFFLLFITEKIQISCGKLVLVPSKTSCLKKKIVLNYLKIYFKTVWCVIPEQDSEERNSVCQLSD